MKKVLVCGRYGGRERTLILKKSLSRLKFRNRELNLFVEI